MFGKRDVRRWLKKNRDAGGDEPPPPLWQSLLWLLVILGLCGYAFWFVPA